jgi:type II secretory pathway pseudopilin PulG
MGVPRSLQAGFTYIGLLVAVVILGLMLTAASRVWSLTEQRERETQLLFIGDEFRAAIARYFAFGHRYPQSLQELLDDQRSPVPRRYLRRLYRDPMMGDTDWTLVPAPGGGIMGVASKSKQAPIKRAGFSLVDFAFKGADCYCLWQFVYQPRFLPGGAPMPATIAPAPTGPTITGPTTAPGVPVPLGHP